MSPARVSRILLCSALPFQTLIVHTAKEGRNHLQSFCGEICRSSSRSAATCRTIPSVLSYPVSMVPVISAGTFPPHPHTSRLLFFSLHHPPCLLRFSVCFDAFEPGYRSRPLAIAAGVARLARSSSPASASAFAAFWPIGLSDSAISSFSIFSRVVRVSSSTSAAVRWAVDIGDRTVVTRLVILLYSVGEV